MLSNESERSKRTEREVAERFRLAARSYVRATGVPMGDRQELEREIVEHLLEAYDAHVASGVTPQLAMDRALEAFGDPRAIRRQFLVRGLARDAVSAARLPRAWWLLLLADALAPVLQLMRRTEFPGSTLGTVFEASRYLVGAIVLLWVGHSAFRLSWRLCRRFLTSPDVEWELATGLGVFATGFGLLLQTGPGYLFPKFCDLIDRSLGRDSAVALTTLAVGLSVSLAALLRDLSRTSDELRAG